VPVYSPSFASFANPANFLVYRNAAQNSGSAAFAIVNFDTKFYDTGNNVDTVTNVGRFTPPYTGWYHLDASVGSSAAISSDAIVSVFKAGAEYARGNRNKLASNLDSISVSITLKLTATTDYIEINCFGNPQFALGVGSGPIATYFSGFLLATA